PAAAQQGGNAQPAPVVVSTAEQRLLAPVTWYPGTVISRNQARLAAEVEGRLTWVADVGTMVPAGDEVARLDTALLSQQLAEDEAAVAREEARLTYLEAEVRRLSRLVRQGSVTQSQLDEAVANQGVTRGELAARRARVAYTRERLERAVVRAPFKGIVTERLLQAGEWAESGQAVARLVDTESLEVQLWVPVHALAFVAPGTELEINTNPHPVAAAVRTIVPVGDNQSRLYELRLRLDRSRWPVGQDVRVAVPMAAPREAVAVHRDALVLRRDGTSVFRIGVDDIAERVSVDTGIAQGDYIEVKGIRPGDRVVIRGGERLRPGQKVVIQKPGITE
ncbi:MAG: efflux RND transporter periplasmic adaptor subunit, partial [Gammaproteobacteria bacterium]|nr:efflux RND transporter periplasmic adaptor subunit [Gammaproteobacteria bacterium]